MTKFNKNKPPKGWMFPFSRRELRSLINDSGATFDFVNFKNTQKPSEFPEGVLWCWIGILKSERIEGKYHFSLELSSLREEHIKPWKEEIVRLLFDEIKGWITRKVTLPPTAPEKPTQLFLKYEIKNEKVSSSCFEVD